MGLVDFAYTSGISAKTARRREQKALGQFMTPPSVARFMAQRCLPPEDLDAVRILDPSAGAGILTAAVVECLLDRPIPPGEIRVVLYEIDERFVQVLRNLVGRMRRAAASRRVLLTASVRTGDFLLSPVAATGRPFADVIIANPPYFKLNASDPRAVAHSYAVYGQPNIYGLFMAVCAGLLNPNGRWCFITPRSWTNGLYFAAVRRHLFRRLHVDSMHVFESRKDHFTDDEILQEAMITWATAKTEANEEVVVSSSEGSRDLSKARLLRVPFCQVIGQDVERTITLPTRTITAGAKWSYRLSSFGLKVSTGPVVAFRAREHICETVREVTVPLLWMQHIDHMSIRWPIGKKGEYVASNGDTAWMLVPNANLVVMRRFSPKEDDRRVTAAPYLAGSLPGAVLGLENHTNYIYRPGGLLSDDEAKGLAAFLNSRVVDSYIRTVVGNTQVNAGDLRKLPLPSMDLLVKIGRGLPLNPTLPEVDALVDSTLDVEGLSIAEAS